jgi:hypothetical protein
MSDRLGLAVRTIRLWNPADCDACGRVIPGGELAVRLTNPAGWIHEACVVLLTNSRRW